MNHDSVLEDEWYQVRHSGEIPEIALHSSLHYLTQDREGPGITLGKEALDFLLQAASERYLEIILRDITPANRGTSIYRGVLRTICNWRRFKRFCGRHSMEPDLIRDEVARRFLLFLENEIEEVKSRGARSSMNCSAAEIDSFAVELDISIEHLKEDLELICINW